MANIARREPRLRGFRLDRIFNDPFFRSPLRGVWRDWPSAGVDAPTFLPVDIAEVEGERTVTASVPGYSSDEVTVHVDDGVLTIEAEHSEESATEEGGEETNGDTPKYIRRERRYGTARRSFKLPADMSDGDLTARLRNGVLTVHIPKVEAATPTVIDIEVHED